MQIYYLDQITEKHYLKFLKLLGVKRKPTETIEETIIRAREELKKPCRAVTLADFEYLAEKTQAVKVARAKAIWNNDRDKVEIIVVPKDGKPAAEGFTKKVYSQLDEHRLLTTQIEVLCHESVRISVRAVIRIKPLASANAVRQRLNDVLKAFFDPLHGYDGSGWPFGRSVYASEVYARMIEVEGVDSVQRLRLFAEGAGLIECKEDKIEIKRNALAHSGTHRIQIVDAQQPCNFKIGSDDRK